VRIRFAVELAAALGTPADEYWLNYTSESQRGTIYDRELAA